MLTKKEKWQLILGSDSSMQLGAKSISEDDSNSEDTDYSSTNAGFSDMQETLDYLYTEKKGLKGDSSNSKITPIEWVNKVRELFSKDVAQKIERHAIEKYNLMELLNDPEVLKTVEPNKELLKNIIQFKSHLSDDILALCKDIIKKVASELEEKLLCEMRQSLVGKRNRNERSNIKLYRNFDIKKTIKKNLKNYDYNKGKLVIDNVYFNSNYTMANTYKVIMVIDESGSMLDSVIYSAVVASIFSKVKNIDLNLVIFDTQVVDLTEYKEDPVEVMLKVQLGGGTYIDKAVEYCSNLVVNPDKTIMILVSDLFEGGSEKHLLTSISSLVESGVKFIALTALDYEGTPYYDEQLAKEISSLGADVASMTPENLAEFVGGVINK